MPDLPLDAGQNRGNIVRWAPAVLEDIQTEFASAIDVGVEHLADELHTRWLVGILFLEMHDQFESTIFEGSISGTNDDRIPESVSYH